MKPYPAYKDSGLPWLGSIPTNWRTAPTFVVLREQHIPNVNLKEKTLLSLSYGRIVVKDIDSTFGLLPASFETYQIVEPGNIVLRFTDLQNDQRSLRVGLAKHLGIITSAYLCLATSRTVIPEYAYYQLHSLDTQKIFYSMGGGLRQSMGYEDLRRMVFLLPPLDEQAAIAAYLDRKTADIERFITKKRQLIALLNEQKVAIINRAVKNGLHPDMPMKASGVDWLGEVPAHWDVAPLYARYQVQLGKMLDAQHITGNYLVPYLRNTDVQWDSINIVDLPQMDFDADDRNKFSLRQGDLLVCEGGAVGRTAVWRNQLPECYYQKALHRLRPLKPKDYPPFFCQVMFAAASQEVFSSNSNKATIDHLPADKFRRYRFPFPSRQEQEAIFEFISSERKKIGIAISKIEREIELIQEYRTTLISEAVTGKIDVREAVDTSL